MLPPPPPRSLPPPPRSLQPPPPPPPPPPRSPSMVVTRSLPMAPGGKPAHPPPPPPPPLALLQQQAQQLQQHSRQQLQSLAHSDVLQAMSKGRAAVVLPLLVAAPHDSGGGSSSTSGTSAMERLNTTPSLAKYEKLAKVGEGTYGVVYKARNVQTNELVALKSIKVDNTNEGFPIAAMREIKALKRIEHENVVRILEVVNVAGPLEWAYIVLEYMEHDLSGLLSRDSKEDTIDRLDEAVVKSLMMQLLRGLDCLHSQNIVHRDIKASNLLINNRGQLKLADFGLARILGGPSNPSIDHRVFTNRVITLGYRPPELLLGGTIYGTEVDIWSAGCILAEMFIGKTYFRGEDEIAQAQIVFKKCGTPTPEDWPGVENYPWYNVLCTTERHPRVLVEDLTKNYILSNDTAALIDRMLALNPNNRVTAAQALQAPYFFEYPPPMPAEHMPRFQEEHRQHAVKPYQPPPTVAPPSSASALPTTATAGEPAASSSTAEAVVATVVEEDGEAAVKRRRLAQ